VLTEDDVRQLVRLRSKQHIGKRKGSSGFTAFCKAHGVNKGHASEFMNGKRAPCSDLLGVLGLRLSYAFKDAR